MVQPGYSQAEGGRGWRRTPPAPTRRRGGAQPGVEARPQPRKGAAARRTCQTPPQPNRPAIFKDLIRYFCMVYMTETNVIQKSPVETFMKI